MLNIPQHFFDVTYNASRYPGAPEAKGLESGANCQHFAYELLRYFGLEIPNFRSSDLWEDATFTERVADLQALDLLLWNKTEQAWGAHVGVYLGQNRAIHLSKRNGVPAIWDLDQFKKHTQYEIFIGAKRIINQC